MCMAKARHMWGKRSGHVWRAGKGEARIGRVQGTCGGKGRTRVEARADGQSTCGGNCGTYKGARVEHVWCKGGARVETKTGHMWGQGRGTKRRRAGHMWGNGRVGVRARSRHWGRSRVGARAGHMWVYEGKGEARRDV